MGCVGGGREQNGYDLSFNWWLGIFGLIVAVCFVSILICFYFVLVWFAWYYYYNHHFCLEWRGQTWFGVVWSGVVFVLFMFRLYFIFLCVSLFLFVTQRKGLDGSAYGRKHASFKFDGAQIYWECTKCPSVCFLPNWIYFCFLSLIIHLLNLLLLPLLLLPPSFMAGLFEKWKIFT